MALIPDLNYELSLWLAHASAYTGWNDNNNIFLVAIFTKFHRKKQRSFTRSNRTLCTRFKRSNFVHRKQNFIHLFSKILFKFLFFGLLVRSWVGLRMLHLSQYYDLVTTIIIDFYRLIFHFFIVFVSAWQQFVEFRLAFDSWKFVNKKKNCSLCLNFKNKKSSRDNDNEEFESLSVRVEKMNRLNDISRLGEALLKSGLFVVFVL